MNRREFIKLSKICSKPVFDGMNGRGLHPIDCWSDKRCSPDDPMICCSNIRGLTNRLDFSVDVRIKLYDGDLYADRNKFKPQPQCRCEVDELFGVLTITNLNLWEFGNRVPTFKWA